jgi:hypothetical protein
MEHHTIYYLYRQLRQGYIFNWGGVSKLPAPPMRKVVKKISRKPVIDHAGFREIFF